MARLTEAEERAAEALEEERYWRECRAGQPRDPASESECAKGNHLWRASICEECGEHADDYDEED